MSCLLLYDRYIFPSIILVDSRTYNRDNTVRGPIKMMEDQCCIQDILVMPILEYSHKHFQNILIFLSLWLESHDFFPLLEYHSSCPLSACYFLL